MPPLTSPLSHVSLTHGAAAWCTAQEWDCIVQRELVTPREIEKLKAFNGNRPFLPLTWALIEIEAALERTHGKGTLKTHVHEDVEVLAERYRVADVLTIFREKAFKVSAARMCQPAPIHRHSAAPPRPERPERHRCRAAAVAPIGTVVAMRTISARPRAIAPQPHHTGRRCPRLPSSLPPPLPTRSSRPLTYSLHACSLHSTSPPLVPNSFVVTAARSPTGSSNRCPSPTTTALTSS